LTSGFVVYQRHMATYIQQMGVLLLFQL